MKLPAKSVAWLVLLLLTGCFHKAHHQPAQSLAPPVAPTPAPGSVSPPASTPAPPSATPGQAIAPAVSTQPEPAPVPAVKPRRRRPKNTPPAVSEDTGVSAMGQLSLGDPTDRRQPTADLIWTTERGLDSIHRRLGETEQKTAAQIREFLKQAREALASGDLDGAHTVALKASVLLGELSR